jgi:outer membrane protein
MKKMFSSCFAPCLGVLFFSSTVLAAEIETPNPGSAETYTYENSYDLTTGIMSDAELESAASGTPVIGAGVLLMAATNPYVDGDTVVRVLPMITYIGERFFVASPGAGFNLTRQAWGNVNLLATYRFKEDAFETKGFLEGMDQRKDSVMAGLNANVNVLAPYRLEFSVLTDVSDRHEGHEVNLSLNRPFRFGPCLLIPGLGLSWRSEDYNDYYYGVRSVEATDLRPAFDPGDSVEGYVRLLVKYQISSQWTLAGSARVERLSDEVSDSPIVDESHITTVFIGLNYSF